MTFPIDRAPLPMPVPGPGPVKTPLLNPDGRFADQLDAFGASAQPAAQLLTTVPQSTGPGDRALSAAAVFNQDGLFGVPDARSKPEPVDLSSVMMASEPGSFQTVVGNASAAGPPASADRSNASLSGVAKDGGSVEAREPVSASLNATAPRTGAVTRLALPIGDRPVTIRDPGVREAAPKPVPSRRPTRVWHEAQNATSGDPQVRKVDGAIAVAAPAGSRGLQDIVRLRDRIIALVARLGWRPGAVRLHLLDRSINKEER